MGHGVETVTVKRVGTAASFLVRPDSEPQLAEVIAAWSASSPPTDPCGFEGTCAADCPMVDLDCPLGLADDERHELLRTGGPPIPTYDAAVGEAAGPSHT